MQAVTLVVLAGGMGSRFGGDKQLATVGDSGKTLLHFSIMDAYAAGVRQVVLIIRPELEQAFATQVLPLLPNDVKVTLVAQRRDDLPAGLPADALTTINERKKPWGTAHALWCARQHLTQPCIVVNADDYYGDAAMLQLVEHFQGSADWAMVAYPLAMTLSPFGGVNRGLCQRTGSLLTAVAEFTEIATLPTGAIVGRNPQGQQVTIADSSLVSMNIWGLQPNVGLDLEDELREFFQRDDFASDECYLPAVIDRALKRQQRLQVYQATQQWHGITYRAELATVAELLNRR